MAPAGKEEVFLDLRGRGLTAEGIHKMFPPPAYFTAMADGAAIPDKAALMGTLADAFRFPSYFGRNWDALLDCLRSLPGEIPAGGYVLGLTNSGAFLSSSAKDREDFDFIVREAAAFLKEKFKAEFKVVFF